MMSFYNISAMATTVPRQRVGLGLGKMLSRKFYVLRNLNKSLKITVPNMPILAPTQPEKYNVDVMNRFDLLQNDLDEMGHVDDPDPEQLRLIDEVFAKTVKKIAEDRADRVNKDIDTALHHEEVTNTDNYVYEQIPKRKVINALVKNKKGYHAYSRLLFWLRCKHFMKVRDHGLINQLVTDARAWLAKNNFTMETSTEFQILANAVMGAYLVNEEELVFRQTIKDKVNYDNMAHINRTAIGDLGKSLFKPRDGGVFPLNRVCVPNSKPIV
jgi:hypothetical protein